MSPLQKQLKIILIGDTCVDEYRYGVIDRISPEAPVPVFRESHSKTCQGMGGNVANNLSALGCEVTVLFGDSQSVKTRYIDDRHQQHVIRVDSDQISDPVVIPSFAEYDAIIVSDYEKGSVSIDTLRTIAETKNKPIFVDTKKTNLGEFMGSNIYFKINEKERNLLKSVPRNLITTIGERGVDFNGVVFPASPVEVADVCGAGDTFIAALAYKFLISNDIHESIRFANRAAAITVQHMGVYGPTLEEICN